VVELTETSLVEHGGVARRRLDALRDLGVRLAVDDFGTGYSSLAYLRRLPLDRIKIDRVFVDDLGGAEEGHSIAAAIVAIARTLGLEACAEGVETPAQARALRAMGCEKAQGYLWAPPLGTADATTWAGGSPPAALPDRPPTAQLPAARASSSVTSSSEVWVNASYHQPTER
jgi:EAL domain-containing protein (putative c-di-GMP-specific phosphodiesterase class I)